MPDNDVTARAGATDAPSADVRPELPLRYGTLFARLSASLLIAGGFVWALRKGGLPLVPAADQLSKLSLAPIAGYFLLSTIATLLRTYRWNYLLRPINPELSARRTMGVSCVGLAAVFFAPMRMGEIVRPWLLSQDREVSFVHAAGTVVAERIVDGLSLTGLLAVSLLFATPLSPLPDHVGNLSLPVALVPAISLSAFTSFALAFLAMVLFYFWRATAHKVVSSVVSLVSKPLAVWVTRQVERVADSLRFLFSRKHGLSFLRDTTVYWAVNAFGHFVLIQGCGVPASFVQTCVTLGVLGLSTLLPSGPGFFGTYQLGVYCGLAMFFPEDIVLGPGALFTFLSYSIQLTLGIISGVFGMWLLSTHPPAHDPSANARRSR